MKVFVDRVVDGDTIEATFRKKIFSTEVKATEHFRLEGIDAPEKTGATKPAGRAATEYLIGRIQGGNVKVKVQGRDKYGRWLATVFKDGVNINDELVQLGFAIYRIY